MSRRRRAVKRIIAEDAKYGSVELSRFINYVMKDGKKTVAQRVVYAALDAVSQETKREPLEIFSQALENSKPLLECS